MLNKLVGEINGMRNRVLKIEDILLKSKSCKIPPVEQKELYQVKRLLDLRSVPVKGEGGANAA